MAKSVMIQGTGSNVGKSLIVAGLCRAALRRGLVVRPFKPQNMSNNAAVTTDGGEIGRAQALQALAAGAPPETDMNPVLLKPETETGAQVIVNGQRLASVAARDYAALKPRLMAPVTESFARIRRAADVVFVEGAGSPAEVNLRAGDIANMGFAEAANIPVVLVGDIDRGGVIAQIVGTHTVLPPDDRARIRGFVVNRFRGDPALFGEGMKTITAHTGWTPLGLAPWFDAAAQLPAEDILDIRSSGSGEIVVAVPRLSRIANFDDLDPLRLAPGVRVEVVEPGRALPGDAELVLIPGSKSTIGDLRFFRAQGWDIDLAAHLRRGGHVLGICGGYQMLGREIIDEDGIEGPPGRQRGLGLLDVVTRIGGSKRLANVRALEITSGLAIEGYEIHMGRTDGPDHDARAWLTVGDRREGARSPDGRVSGAYIHGLFRSDAFRAHFLRMIGGGEGGGGGDYGRKVDETLDALARHLEAHLDIDAILALAR